MSCLTCNGSSESQCITCRSGRFAYEGKCMNSCPDGFFGDKKRQECMACPTGCATCTNNGFCLTCKDSWTKNKKNRCVANGSDNCDECKWQYKEFNPNIQSPPHCNLFMFSFDAMYAAQGRREMCVLSSLHIRCTINWQKHAFKHTE